MDVKKINDILVTIGVCLLFAFAIQSPWGLLAGLAVVWAAAASNA